jgi:hypothetical protein
MGMSNDYELAIAEGANMVRVGTAIFGEPSEDQLDHPPELHDEDDSDESGRSAS